MNDLTPDGNRSLEYEIVTKEVPTFYFIGVTTGKSSINKVFPLWMQEMGRPEVVLEGIDHAIHDDPEAYRRSVAQIKYDPNSLGALVTTHKIDLFNAARDLFDEVDPYAGLTGEVSCIASREDGRLAGYAKDPITAGLSMDAIVGENYFGRTGGHVLLLGAGGSSVATVLHLINKKQPGDRPERIVVVNRSQGRLDHMKQMVDSLEPDIEIVYVCNDDPRVNDRLMAELPPGSIVINATGMGKDTPGSPLTDAGVFPQDGIAWEFNYRGELDFMHQALAQAEKRNLRVEDGWVYFIHGWSQVIGEALNVPITPELFERLEKAAASTRSSLTDSKRGGFTMSKARLAPVYFDPGRDEDFDRQLARLQEMLAGEATFLEPVALGAAIPDEADAVIFPQLLGEAYRKLDAFKAMNRPVLLVTSEFGTINMWDWEIANYLRVEGLDPIAPYNLEQTKTACRALAVRRALSESKFIVYQDNPGEGFQADIFKRFYWWEVEAVQRIFDHYGVTIEKRSFKELAARAKALPDAQADAVWAQWNLPASGLGPGQLRSAVKMYIALKAELEAESHVAGMGINCLNESHFSDTTPCLAWNMLYEEKGLIWGCEADTMSMLTKHILHKTLDVPIMMTNLYPFLMGQAALKHERIPNFPEVDEPENHILVAHCGYLGVVPQSFATEWQVKPRVLAITDPNAIALDARLPEGPMTLAKLMPTMDRMTVVEGQLEGYVQYDDSDCLNGGVLRVSDGHRMVNNISSHHYLLTTGHNRKDIELIGKVFGFAVEAF